MTHVFLQKHTVLSPSMLLLNRQYAHCEEMRAISYERSLNAVQSIVSSTSTDHASEKQW